MPSHLKFFKTHLLLVSLLLSPAIITVPGFSRFLSFSYEPTLESDGSAVTQNQDHNIESLNQEETTINPNPNPKPTSQSLLHRYESSLQTDPLKTNMCTAFFLFPMTDLCAQILSGCAGQDGSDIDLKRLLLKAGAGPLNAFLTQALLVRNIEKFGEFLDEKLGSKVVTSLDGNLLDDPLLEEGLCQDLENGGVIQTGDDLNGADAVRFSSNTQTESDDIDLTVDPSSMGRELLPESQQTKTTARKLHPFIKLNLQLLAQVFTYEPTVTAFYIAVQAISENPAAFAQFIHHLTNPHQVANDGDFPKIFLSYFGGTSKDGLSMTKSGQINRYLAALRLDLLWWVPISEAIYAWRNMGGSERQLERRKKFLVLALLALTATFNVLMSIVASEC